MAKRIDKPIPDSRADGSGDDDLVAARLRRHLHFLGLSHTLDQLDAHLVWATRERPGATALLEHLLGAEAAHKLEQRIGRRIDTSGLVERKALEVFDWDFQPGLDKPPPLGGEELEHPLRVRACLRKDVTWIGAIASRSASYLSCRPPQITSWTRVSGWRIITTAAGKSRGSRRRCTHRDPPAAAPTASTALS
jgi:hypothetical protein